MQVGIDSFAPWDDAGLTISPSECLRKLVEQFEYMDKIGSVKFNTVIPVILIKIP
jgi:hypothetical protein